MVNPGIKDGRWFFDIIDKNFVEMAGTDKVKKIVMNPAPMYRGEFRAPAGKSFPCSQTG